MNKDVVDKGIADYEKHLLELARVFNEYAKTRGFREKRRRSGLGFLVLDKGR